jgi:hypothetical protein
MVVEKLVKSTTSKSRVHKLAQKVKSIQAKKKTQIGIKTYKSKAIKQHTAKYIKSIGLNTVSPTPIPQQLTKLDLINTPIIQPSNINITNMETPIISKPIKINQSIGFKTKLPTPIPIQELNKIPISSPTPKPISTSIPKIITKSQNYIIVIPTFNRPDIIQVKTLALLHRHKINPQNITLFVANKEQHDLYKEKVPAFLYGSIVIGVIGLKNQRNYIMDYYPEGKQIVQMDDDLDKIVELVISKKTVKSTTRMGLQSRRRSTSRKTIKPISDLDGFIQRAFNICKEKGIFLWGVYPLSNSRFMTPKMTTDLRFIVGPMWGIINRHRPDLKLTIDEKENTERTLQHWIIDHAVLRFNNIGIETRYYKNKGGMQNEGKNRKEEALKSVYYLHQKYPNLTKIYLGKKSGVPEIRLHSKSN